MTEIHMVVSKHIFLTARKCRTMGWHVRHNTQFQDATLVEIVRREQGQVVHEYARSQYKNGVFVDDTNISKALKLTAELMVDPSCEVIFEACFRHGRCVARADILIRKNDGWIVEEVKSSKSLKLSLKEDIAYTVMVIKGLGVEIKSAKLKLVNECYRVGVEIEPLLKPVDVTNEVFEIADDFEKDRNSIENDILSESCPDAEWKYVCSACDYFAQDCIGRGVASPIFQIPRIGRKKFDKLIELGITEIELVPKDFKLSERQSGVVEVVKSGEMHVKSGMKEALEEWCNPIHYLDFETVSTCIPVYSGLSPYTQIPTQYSMHVRSCKGSLDHMEYLAEGSSDCRREFIETLLEDVGCEGSIVVYSHFENTTLTNLQKWFSDLSDEIECVKARLVDMEKLIREFVYHPGFYGRTSIKVVLPALVPGMDYSKLEISNGDDALAMFYRLAMGEIHPDSVESTRLALMEYCKLDTLAMVRIHDVLIELANQNSKKI
ncbi:MAG TPA: hypothetical protein DGN60_08120 [Chloroflexi bacterium]|nr:hypothetical protein [Chloroflexota bacterium]